ncbi:alcohol dehydrogenase [Microlunatus endophyticus]|uniref:Alcohol dehydrogenase n=1 Tax=Microlunatus endophyticus TaxID=1716077 RepID=A0A917SH12_9ACTN|nr:alcohol dehydrogenase [Microlunatus endophyticus]
MVITAPGVAELAQVTVTAPDPGEVTVRAEFSGVSTGTDRWTAQGRFDWGTARFPLVPGYQKVGFVVDAGEGAEDWVGRAVFVASAHDFGDAAAQSGGHAEYSNHRLEHVYALRQAQGSEPGRRFFDPRLSLGISIQVGYNAAHRIQPARVRRVAVIGDGIIGLSAALTAVGLGYQVAVVGRHEDRLAIATGAGGIAIDSASARQDVRAFTPEAIIDTIQSAESFAIVIDSLPRDYGQVVYSGFTPGMPDAWASMTVLQQHSITAHFQSGWTRERLTRVLDAIERDEPGFSRIPTAEVEVDQAGAFFTDLIGGVPVPPASVINWRSER